MEANYLKKMDYVCEHNHTFGHTMVLKWGDCRPERKGMLLELSVDFTQGIAGVLVNGALKDTYDLEGMSIEEFEVLIERCQSAYNDLCKFEQQ